MAEVTGTIGTRRNSIINEDPFAEVRLHNIENRGRKTDKFMIEVQKPDSDEFVELPGVGTVHSADYKLITNRQVHNTVSDILERTGMEFTPVPTFNAGHSTPVFWSGRRFSEKWFCKDTAISVPGGSSMMLGLEAQNSYDGSCKVSFAFFAMHVICSNQFYANNLLGRPFEFPHVNRGGDLNDDFDTCVDAIQVRAGNFAKIAPNMQMLQDKHVDSFDGFLELRKRIKDEVKVNFRDKQFLDELEGHGITNELGMKGVEHNDPSSYWDMANAYTAVATHCVGGPRGADQSSRIVDFLLREAISPAAQAV